MKYGGLIISGVRLLNFRSTRPDHSHFSSSLIRNLIVDVRFVSQTAEKGVKRPADAGQGPASKKPAPARNPDAEKGNFIRLISFSSIHVICQSQTMFVIFFQTKFMICEIYDLYKQLFQRTTSGQFRLICVLFHRKTQTESARRRPGGQSIGRQETGSDCGQVRKGGQEIGRITSRRTSQAAQSRRGCHRQKTLQDSMIERFR